MDDRGLSLAILIIQNKIYILFPTRFPESSVWSNWVSRFIERQEELKIRWSRKYDYHRAKCEDCNLLKTWVDRFLTTIQQYSIAVVDIHNCDEVGFQIGVIWTTKVIS